MTEQELLNKIHRLSLAAVEEEHLDVWYSKLRELQLAKWRGTPQGKYNKMVYSYIHVEGSICVDNLQKYHSYGFHPAVTADKLMSDTRYHDKNNTY